MKQLDKLRKTLRAYYDTRPDEPMEDDWAQASLLIETERRKRRLRSLVILLVTLLPVSLVVLLSAGSGSDERKMAALPARQNTVAASPDKVKSSVTQMKSTKPARREVSDRSDLLSPKSSPSARSMPETVLAVQEKQYEEREATESASPPAQAANEEQLPVPENIAAGPTITKVQNSPETETTSYETSTVLPDPVAPVVAVANKNQGPVAEPPLLLRKPEYFVICQPQQTLHKINPPASSTQAAAVNTLQVIAREGLFYEAGGAWLYGWKAGNRRDARGFSPVAGIHYLNQLTENLGFSFGVQYMAVQNLSITSKTSRVSSYVYGEESRVTVITPRTVHYLVAPFRFHYKLNGSNVLGASINVGYLLNVDATVTTYDEKPGYTGNYETIKLGGYTQGFNWIDSQAGIFYTRRIGNRLGIQAEIFMGLVDVKQDDFFRLKAKERNSGARLTLLYYAFGKNH